MTAELKEKLAKAQEARRAAEAAYKRTWKEHPTAKGYPLVDKALDKLHACEAEVERLKRLIEERAPASRQTKR